MNPKKTMIHVTNNHWTSNRFRIKIIVINLNIQVSKKFIHKH